MIRPSRSQSIYVPSHSGERERKKEETDEEAGRIGRRRVVIHLEGKTKRTASVLSQSRDRETTSIHTHTKRKRDAGEGREKKRQEEEEVVRCLREKQWRAPCSVVCEEREGRGKERGERRGREEKQRANEASGGALGSCGDPHRSCRQPAPHCRLTPFGNTVGVHASSRRRCIAIAVRLSTPSAAAAVPDGGGCGCGFVVNA